jgi:formimidoylglutamate deiminase
MTHTLFAAEALLPDGWARHVLLTWDDAGRLTGVEPDSLPDADVPRAVGPVLPGMPNLHSHAFQRGFAGLTEFRATLADSFWSWRELMYRFALRMTPEALEAIATQLYIEMLAAGYTTVCEFHYVHHQQDGQPYADATEMMQALMRAAQAAGIGLTLLPVLYQAGGFGGKPAQPDQRRFLSETNAMLRLVDRLGQQCRADPGMNARVGLAPHSLRAVTPDALREAVAGLHVLDATAPVHIHVAEQMREVEDCIAWSGQRPIAWLLDNMPVDRRWCVIHATHMVESETLGLARSGATAGICPTTEGNLGDGFFDAERYLDAGGAWGIGSDSNASISVTEELRFFEYGQRLLLQRRNVLASAAQPQVSERLYLGAVAGGAQASARPVGGLIVGQQADFVVLDGASAGLAGLPAPQALGAHVFSQRGAPDIAAVWTAGRQRVVGGRHDLDERSRAAFVAARRQLLA